MSCMGELSAFELLTCFTTAVAAAGCFSLQVHGRVSDALAQLQFRSGYCGMPGIRLPFHLPWPTSFAAPTTLPRYCRYKLFILQTVV